MFTDQLDSFIARYAEVTELMSDPDVINDNQRFRAISKEEADLRPKVETFSHYKDVIQGIEDTEELLAESSDDEMTELAKEELKELKADRDNLEEEIKRLMIPS
uniref:PCRF domain-containing protein n=1 Tax=Aerococcus urinaeequi TaxID=51665 RepID=UPI003529E4EA